jgi:hypothetical protein
MVSPWRRSAKTSFTYSSWVNMSVGSSSSVPLQVPKLEEPSPTVADGPQEERQSLSSARVLVIAERDFW